MKYSINAQGVPAAIGPYSQGTTAGRLVFASGQLPISAQNNKGLVAGGITEQTEHLGGSRLHSFRRRPNNTLSCQSQ